MPNALVRIRRSLLHAAAQARTRVAATRPLRMLALLGALLVISSAATSWLSAHRVVEEAALASLGDRASALAAALASRPTVLSQEAPAFLERCVRASDLLFAGIWHESGRWVYVAGEHAALAEPLGPHIAASPSGLCRQRLDDSAARVAWLRLPLEAGQPGLHLVLARSVTYPRALATAAAIEPLIAAIVIALLAGWIRTAILRPLQQIASPPPPGHPTACAQPYTSRSDEVGLVAREIVQLREELVRARARIGELERSLRSRLDSQTRDLTRQVQTAMRTALIDPLTGLGNRRALEEGFQPLFHQTAARRGELSIVLLDLDHFKPVNDTLGHEQGDLVLRFAGELLRSCVRSHDLAIRLGGDEFLLVLPEVEPLAALQIARRLIAMFSQYANTLPVEPRPCMSAGVASIRSNAPGSPQELLRMADEALYAAKRAGRSRVCAYRGTPLPAR